MRPGEVREVEGCVVKFCPDCGSRLVGAALVRFCSACGASLADSQALRHPDGVRAPEGESCLDAAVVTGSTYSDSTLQSIEPAQLAHLLIDLNFITRHDADRLISAIITIPAADRPPTAYAVLQATGRLSQPPARRAALLSLAAAHVGLPTLSTALNGLARTPWQIEWAHALSHPNKELHGHTKGVTAVAIGRLGDRDVIASASHDKTIRIWDQHGRPIGDPLRNSKGVTAVAIGRLGDRDVIATSWGKKIRLWDELGQPISKPLVGHTGSVTAVAIGRLGNRDVVVSGSWDKTIRLWDEKGIPIGDPLMGDHDGVGGVAIGRLDTRDVIVAGSSDKHMSVWDGAGRLLGNRFAGFLDDQPTFGMRCEALAIGRLGDRNVIVQTGDDQSVFVWDAQHINNPSAFWESVEEYEFTEDPAVWDGWDSSWIWPPMAEFATSVWTSVAVGRLA